MIDPDLIERYSGISEGCQTTFAEFLSIYSNEDKLAMDLLLQSLRLQSTWLGESESLTCTTMTWLALLFLKSMSLDEAEVMIDRLSIAECQVPQAQNIFLVDVQLLQGRKLMMLYLSFSIAPNFTPTSQQFHLSALHLLS
jgi:hypothetical protein